MIKINNYYINIFLDNLYIKFLFNKDIKKIFKKYFKNKNITKEENIEKFLEEIFIKLINKKIRTNEIKITALIYLYTIINEKYKNEPKKRNLLNNVITKIIKENKEYQEGFKKFLNKNY